MDAFYVKIQLTTMRSGLRLFLAVAVGGISISAEGRNFGLSEFCAVINGAPVAVNDENFGPWNNPLIGDVSDNDFDPNGDLLTYTVLTPPSNGVLTMQSNGQYVYVPNPAFFGFDGATYQVCDPSGLCATAMIELALALVNGPPVVSDETLFVPAGLPFQANLALNDFDPDFEPIFYNVLVNPSNVTGLSLSMFGVVSFTPNPGFSGTIVMVYQGCDPCGACDVGVATFNVAVNLPPIVNDDSHFTSLNTPLALSVAQNDSDPEGYPLTYSVIEGPDHGTMVLASNGSYVYTPTSFFSGFDYITYEACDPYGLCAEAVLEIEVVFVNVNPVAENDSFTMNEDGVLQASAATNDYDLNVEVLTFVLISGPAFGVVNWSLPTGSFTYTPPSNWSGTVNLVYNACDPCNACDVGVVTIVVNPVNDLPVVNNGSFALNEDQVFNGSVASLASDVESSSLSFALFMQPVNGSVSMLPNGSFSYTPTPNYFGSDSFMFSACDGMNACVNGTITLSIQGTNDLPVVIGESFTLNEDAILASTVASNDSDVETASLIYSSVTLPANGTLVLNANGSFTYTPPANFFGTNSFTYQACDGSGACAQATATISINSVNDIPVATAGAFSLSEDNVLTGSVQSLASDVESSSLTFSTSVQATQGTVVIAANGSFSYTPQSNYFGSDSFVYSACDTQGACATALVSLTISPSNDAPIASADSFGVTEDGVLNGNVSLNDSDPEGSALAFSLISSTTNGGLVLNASGSFVYTPSLNYAGGDQFVYQVCDAQGLCATATVMITVVWVNDLPVAQDDSFSTNEDQVLSANVGVNDSDVDIEPLYYSVLFQPSSGVVVMGQETGDFTYTPPSNFNGFVTFLYLACDSCNACDAGLVSIMVNAINDAPVAQGDSFSLNEDTPFSGTVATNDSDIDSPSRTYSVSQAPLNGTFALNANGSFTYTPALDYFGSDQAIYQVCDNLNACATATVSFTIVPVNDAPVVLGETNAALMNTPLNGSVASNDSDPESLSLTYTLVTGPANGTFQLNSNGSYSYVPETNWSGGVSIIYQACDAQSACGTATLSINVISTNNPPLILGETVSGFEDVVLVGNVAANDSDVDAQPLAYTIVVNTSAGTFTLTDQGAFQFTPLPNWFGSTTVTYAACDPIGACQSAVLVLNIASVNDIPIVLGETLHTSEDEALNETVAENDTDADGDALTYGVTSPPSHGMIELAGDGSFTYIPNTDYFGFDEISYEACDPSGACVSAVLVIETHFVNDWPIAQDDTYFISMNEVITANVSENDIEIDPEPLEFNIVEGAQNGVVVLNSDGTFTYTPNDGFIGTDVVVYSVCDPCGACDTAILYLVVGAVNTAPVAGDASGFICAESEWSFDLDNVASDSEDPNQMLSFNILNSTGGVWSVGATSHLITFIPEAGFTGQAQAEYEVCDVTLGALCSSGLATVQVLAESAPLLLSSEIISVSCFGSSDGSIGLELDGQGNMCIWSTGSELEDLSSLEAGEYSVIISRAGFCMIPLELSFEITQPDPIVISGLSGDPIDETPGGSSDYSVAGGTPPYTYEWFLIADGSLVSEEELLVLTESGLAGDYQLVVSDSQGCSVSNEIIVTGLEELNGELSIRFYPNPVSDQISIQLLGTGNERATLRIFDAAGREVHRDSRVDVGRGTFQLDVSSWSAGVYLLRLETDSDRVQHVFQKL